MGAPAFPGAEAPGYRNPNSRSNYLVDDHNRRAIENLAYRSNYLVDDHKRRAIEKLAYPSKYFVEALVAGQSGHPGRFRIFELFPLSLILSNKPRRGAYYL